MAEDTWENGTAEELPDADPFAGTPLEGATGDTEPDGDQDTTEEEGATSDTEALIPFDQMPPEMRPHIARLTRLHQERMGEIREQQGKIDAYDRFMTDSAYQHQLLQQAAQQLGMELRPRGGNATQQQDTSRGSDNEYQADNPDLQFLVPLISDVVQKAIAPMKQSETDNRRAQQEQEFDAMVADLTEKVPGWEEHEDEMTKLWTFFERAARGGPRIHPRYGNVLHMMHRIVSGDAAVTAEAGRRMRQALNNRSTTSRGRQAAQPNIQDMISKASDSESKWEIAFQDALRRNARR